MSHNIEDLHVSPSQAAVIADLSGPSVKKYVLDFLEPKFQSGKFKFYLRAEVEEYVEKHGHILSLLKGKPRKGQPTEVTQGESVSDES